MPSIADLFVFPLGVWIAGIGALLGYVLYGRLIAKVPKDVALPLFEAILIATQSAVLVTALLNCLAGVKPFLVLSIAIGFSAMTLPSAVFKWVFKPEKLNDASKGALLAGMLCVLAAALYLYARS